MPDRAQIGPQLDLKWGTHTSVLKLAQVRNREGETVLNCNKKVMWLGPHLSLMLSTKLAEEEEEEGLRSPPRWQPDSDGKKREEDLHAAPLHDLTLQAARLLLHLQNPHKNG